MCTPLCFKKEVAGIDPTGRIAIIMIENNNIQQTIMTVERVHCLLGAQFHLGLASSLGAFRVKSFAQGPNKDIITLTTIGFKSMIFWAQILILQSHREP